MQNGHKICRLHTDGLVYILYGSYMRDKNYPKNCLIIIIIITIMIKVMTMIMTMMAITILP